MIFEKEMNKINLFIVDWGNVAQYRSYISSVEFIRYLGILNMINKLKFKS